MSVELRPPTLDDLSELVTFFAEQRARYGSHAMTEGQLRGNLTSKRWSPDENCRVALRDGGIAGWSSMWSPDGGRERIFLTVRAASREQPVYSSLLDWAEQRASELAAGRPARLQAGAEDGDETLITELRGRGYAFARYYFEMQIDLSGELAAPVWPDGLTVRTFTPEDARAVYEATMEAFADHWDAFSVEFDDWSEYFMGRSDFDPGLWFIVEDGEELAGFALCSNEGETSAVNLLGVRRPWRRLGLGRALLLHAFHEFRRRGRAKAGLTVDGENLTGAVRLYERAGMQVAHRTEYYNKELR